MFTRDINRIPSGFLNSGTDAVIGQNVAPAVTGTSQFAGQLGKTMTLDDTMAAALSSSAVGTLFGGVYQYVQFAAGVATWKRGMLAFWDSTAASSAFQVTVTEANGGALGAQDLAGIILHPNTGTAGTITAGQWGWIQIMGKASVLFRAVLTFAGAAQAPVFAAAAGAGADNATADTIGTAVGTTFSSAGLMLERYVGVAAAAPVGGAISVVNLAQRALRIAA